MAFTDATPSGAQQSVQDAANEAKSELEGVDLSNLDNETTDVDPAILKENGIEGDDDGQPEKEPSAKSEDGAEDNEIEDIFKELGQEVPKKSEVGNGEVFKIKHEGKEIELSKDDLIKHAQMGFDYTKKTQAIALKEEQLAKQYETKEAAFKEQTAKFNEDLRLKNQFDFCLDHIKEDDPTFYEEMTAKLQAASRYYSNPVVDKAMQRVAELESQVNNLLNGTKRNEFVSQFSEMSKTLAPKLEKLGIKIDEAKIKDAWINSSSDVKSAVYSVYGEQINKAYASKVKLEAAKKQAPIQKKVEPIKPTQPKQNEEKSTGYTPYGAITAKYLGYKQKS